MSTRSITFVKMLYDSALPVPPQTAQCDVTHARCSPGTQLTAWNTGGCGVVLRSHLLCDIVSSEA